MRKLITACMMLTILSAPAFGDWWNRTDWVLISDSAAGDYSELYGAQDDQWLYLRLEKKRALNMFQDGGFAVHIDANRGTGFDLSGWGWFFTDIELLTGSNPGAQMQETGVWHTGSLTVASGGSAYMNIMDTTWNQPFNISASTYYLRINREQLYHPRIGTYPIAGNARKDIKVAIRSSAGPIIAGAYTISGQDAEEEEPPPSVE